MPGKFNFEIRYKYPHLIGEDNEVWTRFIEKYPDRFETVDYDIKVGEGAKIFHIDDTASQKYWTMLTKKRIDVIGYKNNFVILIEVKKRAGLYTLGQILGYRFLYRREHPTHTLQPVLVICESIDHDTEDVFKHYGITYIIV